METEILRFRILKGRALSSSKEMACVLLPAVNAQAVEPLPSIKLKKVPKKLVAFPPFKDLKPFTMTIVGKLECPELDLASIFAQLKETIVSFPQKSGKSKEGKKVKIDVISPHVGSLISIKYGLAGQVLVKGIDNGTADFHNCINIYITVSDEFNAPEKNISFKLFRDEVHTTGSTRIEHTLQAWQAIRTQLLTMKEIYTEKDLPIDPDQLVLSQLSYKMIDISFWIGYEIVRDQLKAVIDETPRLHAVWNPKINYGVNVNVKYLLGAPDQELPLTRKKFPPCVTFIVFTSGKVVMSGRDFVEMEEAYCLFKEVLTKERGKIEFRPIK